MKNLFCFIACFLFWYSYGQDVYVNGYVTGSGVYVPGHYRTTPNNTMYDNYSTVGNVNPYTGKWGTVQPTGTSYNPVVLPQTTYYNVPSTNQDYSYLKLPDIIPTPSYQSTYSTYSSNTSKSSMPTTTKGGKYFQKTGSKTNYIKQTIHL